jgi:hypothetical protein
VKTPTPPAQTYRAWLIWDRNYWVIVPPLCSICGAFSMPRARPPLRAHRSHACAVSAIISIYHQALLKPGQTFADVPIVVTSADALFVFALITNFTTTALIAGRIFYLFRVRMRGLHATHTQRYVNIVGMIVESGAHAAT